MATENAALDELRKKTCRMLFRLYGSALALNQAIKAAPDLAALRQGMAVAQSQAVIDEFTDWLFAGGDEQEVAELRLLLPAQAQVN